MNWLHVASAIVPTILLLIQGISCLTSPKESSAGGSAGQPDGTMGTLGHPQTGLCVRWFGGVCIFLAGLGGILTVLLLSGRLLLTSELDLAMVQGTGPWYGIAFLLIGIALSAGLTLHVSRLASRRPNHLLLLVGLGIGIGCLAASRLVELNPSNVDPLRIYAYDLWWPPLLMWLSVCLAESVLNVLAYDRLIGRLWLATALIALLGVVALSQPRLADPSSAIIWKGYLLALLPWSMALVTWRFFKLPRRRLTGIQRWIRQGLTVLPVPVGAINIWLWWRMAALPMDAEPWPSIIYYAYWPWNTWSMIAAWPALFWLEPWINLLWLSWPALVGLLRSRDLCRAWRQGTLQWQAIPRPSGQQMALLIAIAALATSLAMLTYFVTINHLVALAFLIMSWTLLAEAIAGGPLRRTGELILEQRFWPMVRQSFTSTAKRVQAWVGKLLSLAFLPVRLATILAVLLGLVVMNELPHAGKTLIFPFHVSALPGDRPFGDNQQDRYDLGQAIAARVANTLGLYQRDLRQQQILSLQFDDEVAGSRPRLALLSTGEGQVDIQLGNSTVPIGGIQVPLGVLLAPIQAPVRALLRVTVIRGQLQVDTQGFVLLASSSAGDTWKVNARQAEASSRPPIDEQAGLSGGDTSGAQSTLALPPQRPVTITPADVVALADDLAFHILGTDAALAASLPAARAALEEFREALPAWREFERTGNYARLSAAIGRLEKVVRDHTGFPLAHYHLGLMYQKAGQSGRAADAFRAGLAADPNFMPAYNALAVTLYDFNRYDPSITAISTNRSRNNRYYIDQAYHIWQQLTIDPVGRVSMANRASAHYGLCRHALAQARATQDAADPTPDGVRESRASSRRPGPSLQRDSWYSLAYFYCKQASHLYARLADVRHLNPEVTRAEAYVLHTLGVTLERLGWLPNLLDDGQYAVRQPEWDCWQPPIRASVYAGDGLRYYMRALDLLPDDRRIHCYAARTAFLLGIETPMRHLAHDADAQLRLATRYRRDAFEYSQYYSPTARLLPQARAGRSAKPSSTAHVPHADESTVHGRYEVAAEVYKRALVTYARAIEYDDRVFEALIGYASTFWEWWAYWALTDGRTGPTESQAQQALRYAQQAYMLARVKNDPLAQAVSQTALARVLLLQGKATSAIKELQPAFDQLQEKFDLTVPHPELTALHQTLLLAHYCAVRTAEDAGWRQVAESSRGQFVQLGDQLRKVGEGSTHAGSDSRLNLFDYTIAGLMCTPQAVSAELASPGLSLPTEMGNDNTTQTVQINEHSAAR